MVKVAKRAPVGAGTGADPDDEVFQQRALELKDEANALYGEHKLKQALEVYEQALSLLEEGDATRAMIHSNRAACYSKMGAFADVVSEASQSLRLDAKSHKAYWHRAQAYLHLGQVAKAKKDLQSVLALDSAHTEAQETLDSLNGVQKPSAPAGLGGMNLKPSAKKNAAGGDKKKAAPSAEEVIAAQQAARAAQAYKEQPSAIQIKAVYGDDIRMFSVYATIGFRDLVTSISTKFATTAQFSIKYEDEDGVMRNLQSRTDFQKSIYATSTRLKALEKPPIMPYVKLFVQDLPKIEDINLVDEDGNPTGLAPNEVVEIDEWILDFSSLFREHLGIDAEGHLDLHQEVRALLLSRSRSALFDDDALSERSDDDTPKLTTSLITVMNVFANVFRSYRELLRWGLSSSLTSLVHLGRAGKPRLTTRAFILLRYRV
jgi:tetratricopeptide (TPR) repeat protein